MRALILVAGAALAVSACGKGGTADNATNVDQDLATQNIGANDTTAIDAATGADANMAADVNFTVNETDSTDSGPIANNAGKPTNTSM